MLVLARRKDEAIRIGDRVRVVVIEVRKNGSVRLGIAAPRDIAVDREEIRIQKDADRRATS